MPIYTYTNCIHRGRPNAYQSFSELRFAPMWSRMAISIITMNTRYVHTQIGDIDLHLSRLIHAQGKHFQFSLKQIRSQMPADLPSSHIRRHFYIYIEVRWANVANLFIIFNMLQMEHSRLVGSPALAYYPLPNTVRHTHSGKWPATDRSFHSVFDTFVPKSFSRRKHTHK